MYPHYDKEKTFEDYNFIIEDLELLDSVTNVIRKGKEIFNQSTRNEFNIRLFEGNRILKTWSFNPKYHYIRIDGKSYKFDASQILSLAKQFGFRYSFSKKTYRTKEQFEKDYREIKSNPDLLFVYEPNFKFDGTFEVKFPKNRKFKHPKATSEYLREKIAKVRDDKQYRVYYVLTEYNRKNSNQFTMTIESDSELFEWFNDKNGEKKDWKSNEYSATIFIKN